jgi:hypothetical protein
MELEVTETKSQRARRPTVDDAIVAEIAAETDTATRSVERRLAGLPVRGKPGRRIDIALAKRGLL